MRVSALKPFERVVTPPGACRTQAYLTSGLILILNLKTVHLLQDATLAQSRLEKCGIREVGEQPRRPRPVNKKTATPADDQNRAR